MGEGMSMKKGENQRDTSTSFSCMVTISDNICKTLSIADGPAPLSMCLSLGLLSARLHPFLLRDLSYDINASSNKLRCQQPSLTDSIPLPRAVILTRFSNTRETLRVVEDGNSLWTATRTRAAGRGAATRRLRPRPAKRAAPERRVAAPAGAVNVRAILPDNRRAKF